VKRYQDTICHTCRETVIRATLAKAAHPPTSSGLTLIASQPIAHPSIILSEPTGTTVVSSDSGPTSATPGVQVAAEPSLPVASPSGVHSPRPRGNNPGKVAAATSSGAPRAHLPISTSPIYSADSQLRAPSISETSGPTQVKPDDSDWSVKYNPNIKQNLRVRVANTFTYKTDVVCTKFSHDGNYLAVGLWSGETHIYNMMTGSKRSTFFLACRLS
jgi:hypothetical protein